MRHLGTTLHALAAAATIAAIWSPIGTWWQWLTTALLLFLAGALAHGTHAQNNTTPTLDADHPTGNATGPHLHHDTTRAGHTSPHNNYGTPA